MLGMVYDYTSQKPLIFGVDQWSLAFLGKIKGYSLEKFLIICIASLVFTLSYVYFNAAPVVGHAFFKNVDDFAIIAHQGGNLERPDETLLALDYALAVPSDILEFDIHLSKDHHLILMHDSRVDRTTNGKGEIENLTLSELKALNAAHWWPLHNKSDLNSRTSLTEEHFPFRRNQLRIATLKEVFEHFPNVPMLIEIKSKNILAFEVFAELVEQYQRWDKVIVASFHVEPLEQFRFHFPKAATAATKHEVAVFVLLSKLGLSALYSPDANALQVPMQVDEINIVTPSFIKAAHQRGMQVHVWTLNTKQEMQQAIKMGVDGIITDRPKLLREIVQQQSSIDI